MEKLRTCLIISDDPDDHQILYEALKSLSDNLAILITLEVDHVIPLVKAKLMQVDYLILDAGLADSTPDFIRELQQEKVEARLIVYADPDRMLNADHTLFTLNKRLPFSEMCSALGSMIQS